MKYQSPSDAAASADVLLDFLIAQERAGSRYIYRGQLREWAEPIMPSIYRRCIPLQRTYARESEEFRYCLRRLGNSFFEIKPDSYVERIAFGNDFQPGEYDFLEALALDPGFALLVATHGMELAVPNMSHPAESRMLCHDSICGSKSSTNIIGA